MKTILVILALFCSSMALEYDTTDAFAYDSLSGLYRETSNLHLGLFEMIVMLGCLAAGIAAGVAMNTEPTRFRWYNMKNRPPPKTAYYFLYTEAGLVERGYFNVVTKEWKYVPGSTLVTHWMRIPKIPKGGL
jgi:hypothetical protein